MQSRRRKPQQRARTRHAFFALRRTYLADEQRRANPNLDRGQLSWSRSQNVSQARGRRWQARAYPLPPRTRPTSCVSSPLSLFRTFRGFPRTGNQMKTHRFVQHARAELVQPDLIAPFPPTSDRRTLPCPFDARPSSRCTRSLPWQACARAKSLLLPPRRWTVDDRKTTYKGIEVSSTLPFPSSAGHFSSSSQSRAREESKSTWRGRHVPAVRPRRRVWAPRTCG